MEVLTVKKIIRKVGSQQQLADTLGVTRQTVKRWVRNNRVSLTYVVPFCQLTGATPEQVNGFAKEVLTFQKRTPKRKKSRAATTPAE